jgi:hypothetical protein
MANTNMLTLAMNKAQESAQTASAMRVSKAAIEKSLVDGELKVTQMRQESVANSMKVAEKAASSINF